MIRATSTNFNKMLYSVALIFIFKKYLALRLGAEDMCEPNQDESLMKNVSFLNQF